MPADIVGTNVLVEQDGQRQFRFQPGPVFANLLLADEINRATPKTQSALLEAMQEQQVSVARERHKLEPPFFVLATQNPLEMEGTYPLPEAQLDRFLFKLWVPFPSEEDLVKIMERTTGANMPQARKRGRRRRRSSRCSGWRAACRSRRTSRPTQLACSRRRTPTRRARPSWCANTSATAARRAAPRRSC